MKTLQNDFTTLEQSKQLLRLGVPVDSANYYFEKCTGDICIIKKGTFSTFCDKSEIPCWSAGRLIEIFEICTGLVWQNEVIDGYTKIDMLLEDFDDRENKYHFDFSKLEG